MPNRTSVQIGAGSPVTTSFDGANRPTADSAGGSYTSDPDGRLTSRPGQRLSWDTMGRLTEVLPATGSTPLATYTYDPLDRLRLVDYGSSRVRFRYVGLTTSVAQTLDDVTGAVIRHVGTGWTGERLLDWTGSGQNLRYDGTNAHHDVVWTAGLTGAVTATLRYDPWGNLTASSGSSLPDFRFQGSWFDTTTELAWVITRWYAPALGRFVSEDSLVGDPVDPPSRHLYAYAAGEPIGRWDPDGRSSVSRTIRNNAGLRGRFELELFIQAAYNDAPFFRFFGDARSFTPSTFVCQPARGCLAVDLSRRTVRAQVNQTCSSSTVFNGILWTEVPFTRGCNSAFPIVGSPGGANGMWNLVKIVEWGSGRIDITWDLTQSRALIVRPDLTINGRLSIIPLESTVKVYYEGDGFPSEELTFIQPSGRRSVLFQHKEGAFLAMAEALGNWSTTKYVARYFGNDPR